MCEASLCPTLHHRAAHSAAAYAMARRGSVPWGKRAGLDSLMFRSPLPLLDLCQLLALHGEYRLRFGARPDDDLADDRRGTLRRGDGELGLLGRPDALVELQFPLRFHLV